MNAQNTIHDAGLDALLADLNGPWGVEETATGAVLTYKGVAKRALDSVSDAKDIAKQLNRHSPPVKTFTDRGLDLFTRAYPARFPRLVDYAAKDMAEAHKDAEPRDVVGQLYLRIVPEAEGPKVSA